MHDQWLSEGFADFSAGVYLQLTEKKRDKYFKYLDRSRDMILDKNKFGRRPNDAGPLWMGLRLSTRRNAGAYQQLVYPKGGYILHMLRMMMLDPKTGEANFKKMMRDYVSTHLHKSASTESFIDVVERHMTPVMNVTGNNKMDWFFSEWVYGTDVPRYTLDYNVAPQDGKFLLTAKLTQSEVTERFAMVVPIYIEFNSGAVTRLGTVTMFGNSSQDKISVVLPEKPKRVLVNYFRDVLEQK
jgi:aminopeptidase N